MENVLFGAEFDASNYRKGAQEIIESLQAIRAETDALIEQSETMQAANADLKKSMEDLAQASTDLKDQNKSLSTQNKELEKDLRFQQAELKKVDAALTKVNTATKQGREEARQLRQRKRELNAELQATAQALNRNNQTMAANNAAIKANQTATQQATATIRANTEAVKLNAVEIKKNEKALKDKANSLQDFERKSGGATKAVSALYGGLRTMANILPGLGIAGLIGLIYELGEAGIKVLFDTNGALDEAIKKQKLFAEVSADAGKQVGGEVAKLELYRLKLNDTSLTAAERVKVAKEYNKIADDQNKIDTTQINNLDLINQKIDRQIKLIQQRALAVSATAKLGTFADKVVEAELDINQRVVASGLTQEAFRRQLDSLLDQRGKAVNQAINSGGTNRSKAIRQNQAVDAELKKLLGFDFIEKLDLFQNRDKLKAEFDKAAQSLNELITIPGLTTQAGQKDGKTVENVFRQKLVELRARLAAVQASEFQSEPLIRKKFEEQIEKEYFEIEKLLTEKKLTRAQAGLLKGLLDSINSTEMEKAITDFRKKQADALQKIDDAIQAAAVESATRRIATIRDEFDRERQQIDQSFEQTTQGLQTRLRDLLKGVDDDMAKGLLTPKQGRDRKGLLHLIFGDLMNSAELAQVNAQLELAFRTFQNTIKEAQRSADELLVSNDERTRDRVVSLTEQYFAGALTYANYQEELTRITREGAAARNNIRLQELQRELQMVNDQLAQTTDATIRKKLEDQQRQIRGQIAGLQSQINQDAAKADQDSTNKRIQNLMAYANAVQGVLASVASFWAQVNAVEQASLDRSIALQQRRVDNAREIAEKGNAEYLEMELKRMDQLERKREENARRQMAINAALTMSQALVAAVGAVAQAVSTGSPLAAIGALGAVVGAIGAAFAFANSLQPPVANFYEGTEYVDGTGRPRGKDTVPARLNIGERVVPTDTNHAYWDALTAIHHHTIPPDVLNSFVNHYPQNLIPTVDFSRLSEATDGRAGHDSIELANELKETNRKLELLIEVAGRDKVYANLDQDGFALGVTKALDYKNKMKKA